MNIPKLPFFCRKGRTVNTSRSRSWTRIGLVSVVLALAAASAPPSADATPPAPVARAGNALPETENFVTWVYRGVLFREPDQEGLTYWSDQVQQHGRAPFVH